jgi:hypothetical protein
MEIKECPKCEFCYGTYEKALRHKGRNVSSFTDLEKGGPSNDGCLPRPRGHKDTKADLKHDASVLALSAIYRG